MEIRFTQSQQNGSVCWMRSKKWMGQVE